MSERLHGRAALVTGGSRGIGLAVARRLLDEGARVVVTSTTDEGADHVRAALDAGDRLVALRSDTRSRGDVSAALTACRETFGSVDIAVANAGIERPARLLDVEDGDWRAVLGVNLDGAFLLTQLAARQMCRQGGGRIVLIASTNAFAPEAGSLAYNVAKAGVAGLARAAALEVASDGVTVNAVGPGLVDTDMSASVVHDERAASWYRERIPLRRFGSPADVAGAVAFLASDDAAWITGHHLVVDGGQTVGLDLPEGTW